MLCREQHEISFTVLLANCHDVTTTGEFHAKQVWKGLQNGITNQEEKRTFRKSLGDLDAK